MSWFDDLLEQRASAFILDEVITGVLVAVGAAVILISLRQMIAGHTRRVMTANIEKLDRPFTVGFSPDLPGIRDAYCVDAWVRTSPIESLFFNPKTGRWQAQNLTFGVGAAFIPGALVTFRAVPTDISEEFLSALQHACEERHIPEDLLNRMADMDPNEVFSIVEAIGLVRPFNIALEAIQAPTPPAANGVFTAFGVDTARRALDLD